MEICEQLHLGVLKGFELRDTSICSLVFMIDDIEITYWQQTATFSVLCVSFPADHIPRFQYQSL